MPRPNQSVPEAQRRRARYYELRRQGVDAYGAMLELGISETTRALYERWFRVIESGQEIIPGRYNRERR
jgi:hypothetical protein